LPAPEPFQGSTDSSSTSSARTAGGGLLAAITLDGIPENLALGVALIGAGPLQVASLSGSIFLSNLPEAAGGAQQMANGRSKLKVLGLWTATAALLSAAALAGNLLFAGVPDAALGLIRCVAGGAFAASLATEVFPKAFKEDSYTTGIATALGLVLAIGLDQGSCGSRVRHMPPENQPERYGGEPRSAADASGSPKAITTFTSSSWAVKAAAKSVSGTRRDTRLSSHRMSARARDAAASR